MRRDQLKMAKRGVDLLLGHLKGADDSLDTALANEDENALIVAADPLVTVAAILIRMLRDASNGTVDSALALTRPYVDTEIVPADQLQKVESLITELISGFRPGSLREIHHGAVAMIAHDIAIGAATEISAIDSRHMNKVVADLRVQLKEQGDDVQISDRDGSIEAAIKYAADEAMQKARWTAAFESANYWQKAAYDLHIAALREDISNTCQDSVEGLALVAVTTKTLATGILQLVRLHNIYPAWTLLRQIVEAEFIFWKFSQDASQIQLWLHSTADERRQNWQPRKVYRDDDNDYRQKDYWVHCERGGHPTPDGARLASQGRVSPISWATLLSDMTDHLWDGWKNLLSAVAAIDTQCNVDMTQQLAPIASAYEATMRKWKSVDHLSHAVAFFSDPID
ncbi:MAG: hypothetical protein ACRDRL_02475 [Sciscionella sp.]